jgi:hypothetical protein
MHCPQAEEVAAAAAEVDKLTGDAGGMGPPPGSPASLSTYHRLTVAAGAAGSLLHRAWQRQEAVAAAGKSHRLTATLG